MVIRKYWVGNLLMHGVYAGAYRMFSSRDAVEASNFLASLH